MDMKTKVEKYSKWYEVIDAMRGIESIPVSELLQMAFSAGIEAAEQSVQPTWVQSGLAQSAALQTCLMSLSVRRVFTHAANANRWAASSPAKESYELYVYQ